MHLNKPFSSLLIYIRHMVFARVILLFMVIGAALNVNATADTVTIKITVLDADSKRPLTGVSIINPQGYLNVATDGQGKCEFKALKTDGLFLFYPGYRTSKFTLADSVTKKEYTLKFVMEQLSTGLSQPVIIKAPKTLDDIEAERKKLGITPKELEKPDVSPFTSPITALYEMISSRAREREKLKQQIETNERERVFVELLRYYNENGLMDLPEDHFYRFIDYCNLPTDFLKYNSNYEITKTIIDFYKRYGRLNGIIK